MFRKKLNKLPTGDLEMQVVDWCNYDVNFTEDDDSYDSDEGEPRYRKVDRKYVIRAYGLNAEGQSMCVHINDFTPYFFIRIPQKWTQKEVNRMVDEVGKKVKYYAKQALLNSQIVMKKEFYGFTNNKEFKFVRLVFKNIWAFRQYIEVFKKAIRVNNKVYKFPLYESNILPMLRFMHCRDVIPAAWIKIPKGKYDYEDITRCQIEVSVNWKDVEPLDKNDIGPVIIASFDLECTSGDGSFPVAKKASDKIIQIGTTVHKNGDDECFLHHILTLKKPEEIKKEEVDAENLIVEYFDDEKKMIIAWGKFIEKLDPDIITGYNIWGFDMAYLYDRAKLGNGGETFDYSEVFLERLSRNKEEYAVAKYREQELSSSALGDNTLKFFEMEGLVSIDMLKVIQRDHKLESYKLDFVAKNFLVPERVDMFESKYFELMENNMGQTALSKNKEYIEKLEEFVEEIEEYGNLSRDFKANYQENKDKLIKIGNMKELDKCIDKCRDLYKIDLPPRKIFENYVDGTPEKIKEIAVYCLKDCELVNKLIMKLNILPNNIGMANVCCVPFSYLFTRGQGIKIFSLMAKECRKEGFLIKVLKPDPNDKSSYEGAIVFTPKPGIYFEPIAVNDYASLYPSSMIAENLSHDSLVWVKVYDNEDNLLKVINGALETIEEYEDGKLVKKTGELRYTDLDDYNYNEIKYDNFEKYDDSKHSNVDKKYIITAKPDNKVLTGYTVCCFVENKDGSKNLLPRVLQKLLQARKDTRKRIEYKTIKLTDGKEYSGLLDKDNGIIKCEKEGDIEINVNEIVECNDTFDDFMKTVWDSLQLAFKITGNSLYGGCGNKVGAVANKYIAASTTSVGRSMVLLARDKTLEHFPGTTVVYGDTDSIFINFSGYISLKHPNEELTEYRKMELTERYCTEAANLVTSCCKNPNQLEYEKILFPFIIFSKKRYVSNKYEGSITKFKQNSMGIVLKRRDNAPIVKDIYGGIIDTILNERNIDKAKDFFKERVANLLEGNADIKRLIITKSLRGNYANPTQIAHKVLADRIGERDPGNKPMPSDRIPYCYIDPEILTCHKCGKDKLNEKDCKCRVCMKLYCNLHLNSHRELCKKMCRFCRKETPASEIKMCKTCGGYYCKEDMVKHTMRTDKYKEVHYDKCKKLLPQKLIQGDILEHPDYIMEKDLKIDYKYYLDHQIEKPCMQIFSLTMKNPYSLIATAVRKYNNKRNGNQEITQWFQIMNKTQAPMDDEEDDDEENIRTYNVDDIFGPIQDTNDYTDGFDNMSISDF